jgi:hypothetical protein
MRLHGSGMMIWVGMRPQVKEVIVHELMANLQFSHPTLLVGICMQADAHLVSGLETSKQQ